LFPTALRLVIYLNRVICSLVPIPEQTFHITQATTHDDNEADDVEDNDLLNEVDWEYERGGSADAEDGPDWMFEADEVASDDTNYVFCPLSDPHGRKTIPHFMLLNSVK
jgi:hypothetical protein